MNSTLSEQEKQIILSLIELQDQNCHAHDNIISNFIERFLPNECYLTVTKDGISLYIQSDLIDKTDSIDRLNEIQSQTNKLMMSIFNVFKLFENERYILFFNEDENRTLGNHIKNVDYFNFDNAIDSKISKEISAGLRSSYILTNGANAFVSNDFLTTNEKSKQFEMSAIKKQLYLTQAALACTVISIIVQTAVSIWGTTSVEIKKIPTQKKQDLKIEFILNGDDSVEIRDINKRLKQIEFIVSGKIKK